jgi:hypothetical protein
MLEPGVTVVAAAERESISVSGVGEVSDQPAPLAVTPTSARTESKDVAWALDYQVPSGPRAGTPLRDLELEDIDGYMVVVEKKIEKGTAGPGWNEFHSALETALSVKMRERAESQPAPRPPADTSDHFGDGSMGPPLPGEVEQFNAERGELPLGDAPSGKTRDALREG